MIALAAALHRAGEPTQAPALARRARSDFGLVLASTEGETRAAATPSARSAEAIGPGSGSIVPQPAAAERDAAALLAQVAPQPSAPTSAPSAATSVPTAAKAQETASKLDSAGDDPDPARAEVGEGAAGAGSIDPDATPSASVPVLPGNLVPTPLAPQPASAPSAPPSEVSEQVSAKPGTGRPKPQHVRGDTSRRASAPATFEPAAGTPSAVSRGDGQPFAVIQSAASAAVDVTGVDQGRVPAAPGDIQIDRHLDLAQDHAWLDRLAQDIAASAGDASRIRFALAPEHLGRLTVEIANGADGTAVRLTTETEQAHRILADAQPRLIAEARAQGLRVTETNVDLDQRSGSQQQSGSPQQQAAMAGPSGQGGGDRARPGLLWDHTGRETLRLAPEIKAEASDLYA